MAGDWHKVDKTYWVAMSDCWDPFKYKPTWNKYNFYDGFHHPWHPVKLNRTNGPFTSGVPVHIVGAKNWVKGCSSVILMPDRSV